MKKTFSEKELLSMWNRVKEPTLEELIGIIENQREEAREYQNVILKKLLEIYEEMNLQRRRIEKLEGISADAGVVRLKEMTVEEAMPLVETFLRDYMKTHEYVYPSDVADELGLKYELVREIFDILEKEGKLKKRAK